MCLDKLSNFNVRLDDKGEGWGWKVFRSRAFGLFGEFCSMDKLRPKNKWLKARDYNPPQEEKENPIYTEIEGKYEPAFHLFKTKEGANVWVGGFSPSRTVIKIKFRDVIGKGIIREHQCIVAREIFIPTSTRGKNEI